MKRIVCFCIIFALLWGTVPAVFAGVADSSGVTFYRLGDVDENDAVNAKDALLVLKFAVGKLELTQNQMLAAEVNGDGELDAKDALNILKYAVGKIAEFPVEIKE